MASPQTPFCTLLQADGWGSSTAKAADGTVLLLGHPAMLLACVMAVLDAQLGLLPMQVV